MMRIDNRDDFNGWTLFLGLWPWLFAILAAWFWAI